MTDAPKDIPQGYAEAAADMADFDARVRAVVDDKLRELAERMAEGLSLPETVLMWLGLPQVAADRIAGTSQQQTQQRYDEAMSGYRYGRLIIPAAPARQDAQAPTPEAPSEEQKAGAIGVLKQEIAALRSVIRKIYAKATPYGAPIIEQGEEYVRSYLIPAGPLHQAVGLAGHGTAAPLAAPAAPAPSGAAEVPRDKEFFARWLREFAAKRLDPHEWDSGIVAACALFIDAHAAAVAEARAESNRLRTDLAAANVQINAQRAEAARLREALSQIDHEIRDGDPPPGALSMCERVLTIIESDPPAPAAAREAALREIETPPDPDMVDRALARETREDALREAIAVVEAAAPMSPYDATRTAIKAIEDLIGSPPAAREADLLPGLQHALAIAKTYESGVIGTAVLDEEIRRLSRAEGQS